MQENYKIVFLASSLTYPFYRKRIYALSKLVGKYEVIGFERNLKYSSVFHSINYLSLGFIRSGHYFYRLKDIFCSVSKVRCKCKDANIIYFFGLDMGLLLHIALMFLDKRPTLVYEVQDIRAILTKRGIIPFALRQLEKYIVKKADLLVVTTKSYVDNYYVKILKINDINYFVLENKLLPEEIPTKINYTKSMHTPIRIGYFGSIRCEVAWSALLYLVNKSNGQIQLYVRGVPKNIDSFYTDIEKYADIYYEGPYKDPEDLEEIYTGVDLVWAAGFHGKSSYAWARSCRFYNACCFKVPIIAQKNTDEGNIVEKLNIGFCVDIKNVLSLQAVERLSTKMINRWRKNLINLPEEIFQYGDEHNILLEKLIK